MNLLIVEDEYQELNFLTRFINKHFHDSIFIVAAVSNGRDALGAIEKFSIDLALLDIEVPLYDGLTIAQKLKETYPEAQVIMLTAYGTFEYAQRALRIGVNDYLVKPYLSEELAEIIMSAIGSKEQVSSYCRQIPFLEKEPEHPVVRMALSYITKNYAEHLSLAELAEELNISDDHLGKCLKKDIAMGFSELLSRYRIHQAQRMLSTENITAAEVAHIVGFSDPNYFYKCFKKYTGVSAKTYANLNLKL